MRQKQNMDVLKRDSQIVVSAFTFHISTLQPVANKQMHAQINKCGNKTPTQELKGPFMSQSTKISSSLNRFKSHSTEVSQISINSDLCQFKNHVILPHISQHTHTNNHMAPTLFRQFPLVAFFDGLVATHAKERPSATFLHHSFKKTN